MDPFDWKELFAFSARERRGIYALLFLILLVMLAKGPVTKYAASPEHIQDTTFQHQVEQWLQGSRYDTFGQPSGPSGQRRWLKEGEVFSNRGLFAFDPNKAGEKELQKLGFSDRVTANLLKYREKGGYLDAPDELLKIYGMDSAFYSRVKDCIRVEPRSYGNHQGYSRQTAKGEGDLPTELTTRYDDEAASHAGDGEPAGSGTPKEALAPIVGQDDAPADMDGAGDRGMPEGSGDRRPFLHLELNSADTFQLARLPGIGRVYAKRICKYRDLLGGYADLHQLTEVYGLNEETVRALQKYLSVDTTRIRSIPINRAGYGDLVRHPYLDAHQTKAILFYRSYRQGKIKRINELLVHNILDQKTYQQMQPYLSAGPR